MNLAEGGPVSIRGNDLLAVDLGMEDLVHDAIDRPDAEHDGPCKTPGQSERQEGDAAAGEMGFVKGERIDRPGCQRQLVQRKAAKRAADVLLAVAPHQLGDLRAKPGVDLGVAFGFVGEEVDRGELDRLEKRLCLAPAGWRRGTVRSLAQEPVECPEAGAVPNFQVGGRQLGQPDQIGIDLEPARQPGLEGEPNRVGRTGQAVNRNRVAVVVENQQGRLLHQAAA